MEGVRFPEKKCFEDVRFNVISITRWAGVVVEFPEQKRYITLEWPLNLFVAKKAQIYF